MWAAAAFVAALGCSVAAAPAPAAPTKWVQDVFGIADWVAPNPDGRDQFPGKFDGEAERRYAEYAAANFTVMLGSLSDAQYPGGPTPGNSSQTLEEQVVLAEKHGLRIIPSVAVSGGTIASGNATLIDVSDRVASSTAFWGFDFFDEPNTKLFPALAGLSKQVGKKYPGKLRFINLLPNYAAAATQLFAKNYTDYVARFVTEMSADGAGPDIICMDHYPFFEDADGSNATTSVAGYRANLGVLRAASLRADVPFWNFFNAMPFGGHSDPTDAQIRWQIFTSLAYGAKGVLYFCYFSPAGPGMFARGGGVIYPRGPMETLDVMFKKGSHYEDARRVNSVLKVYGSYLIDATSTGVYRVQPADCADTGYTNTCAIGEQDCPTGEQPNSDLSACAVNATDVSVFPTRPGNGLLIGQFKLADGRTAVLLQNQNWDMTLWPTVGFPHATAATVVEVDPEHGTEAVVLDDSPYMPGLQLSFTAGGARLLILPKTAAAIGA